ncbi:hypothetical protein SAMD00020551_3843 [Mesobacillus selenatarsenatis SF-1]|uniref:Uncharacterized protein n=1 Tax=Mesobacillus selenatarsenatis (strain DSM 18680 / JCM 14380 / FERM P-15431 / SF-1) TaxID=1321606 RepID=A0A0A8XBX2_MESS1|nr:hypothetical protein SAMD00020551_3843 [Mesobacillus selenatarsenatis SF-1]
MGGPKRLEGLGAGAGQYEKRMRLGEPRQAEARHLLEVMLMKQILEIRRSIYG